MKVLQVNCVYKKGSTGKITYDLHKGLLDAGIESVVCYGRGEEISEPGIYKTCPEWYSKLNNALSRVTGIMYGGCFFSTNQLISIIQREQPNVVHLQCINGFFVNIYRLVNWLKVHHIKTVLTLHAEFMYTGGCGYSIDCNQWNTRTGCGHSKCPRFHTETGSLLFDRTAAMWKRMKNAFDGFEADLIVTSVSPWLMERAEKAPILSGKSHRVVLNGLDTVLFHPQDTKRLRESLGITVEKIIFHATPAFSMEPGHMKGGYYVSQLAKRLENENVKLIVAGPYSSDAILPDNMIMLGRVADQGLLAQYYSMADVTVLTSKRETFSMICAESLSCGTPIVGFRAGAPEQISLPEYSTFVPYGDLDSLETAVRTWIGREKKHEIAETAGKIYDKNVMVENYINTYLELLRG